MQSNEQDYIKLICSCCTKRQECPKNKFVISTILGRTTIMCPEYNYEKSENGDEHYD